LKEFQKYGVVFISLTEGIDTSTDSQFIAHVSAIANFEHTIHQERICEGLTRARRQGKRLGRRPKGSDHPETSANSMDGA
jgi:DNA invertase Pin-like site-specific DNA recombinase